MDNDLHEIFFTDKDDPAVLKQRPPKFDADLIAELVIRIITTTNSKRRRNSVTDGSSSSAESSANNVTILSNESSGSVPQLSQHNNIKGASSTKIGGNNRLANLQRTAAKIRNEATTSTTTVNATTTSTNSAVSSTINTNDNSSNTATSATSATSTASEETGDAILVFLSGIQSIEKVNKALRQRGILHSLKAQVHFSRILLVFLFRGFARSDCLMQKYQSLHQSLTPIWFNRAYVLPLIS